MQTPITLSENILQCTNRIARDQFIVNLHKTKIGAEVLRLIVRDNVNDAGDIVANALWNTWIDKDIVCTD